MQSTRYVPSYATFRKYNRFADNFNHNQKPQVSVSVSSFCKLFTLYIVLIGMITSVVVCSYKIYTDSWLEDLKTRHSDSDSFSNFLLDDTSQVAVPQNDSGVADFIREYYIRGPSSEEYNWTQTVGRSGYSGVNTKVRALLGKLDNGFFVEANVGDGVTRSNTKILEVNHGWTGILIEPSVTKFQRMVGTNRKSTLVNSCVSTIPHPSQQEYYEPLNYSISEPQRSSKRNLQIVKMMCFPLFSIFTAVNVFQIDYLSLDVNGKELQILQTLPFDSVFIKVISATYTQIPEGGDDLRDFLVSKGYQLVGEAGGQFIFMRQNTFINSNNSTSTSTIRDRSENGIDNANEIDNENNIRLGPSVGLDLDSFEIVQENINNAPIPISTSTKFSHLKNTTKHENATDDDQDQDDGEGQDEGGEEDDETQNEDSEENEADPIPIISQENLASSRTRFNSTEVKNEFGGFELFNEEDIDENGTESNHNYEERSKSHNLL